MIESGGENKFSAAESEKGSKLLKALRSAALFAAMGAAVGETAKPLEAQIWHEPVTLAEKSSNKKEEKEQKKLKSLEKQLESRIGERGLSSVPYDFLPTEETNEKHSQIDNLVSKDGEISSDTIRGLLNTLPKNWGEDGLLFIKNSEKSVQEENIDERYKNAKAIILTSCSRGGAKITLYKDSRSEATSDLLEDLYHEFGHKNDPICHASASREKRITLLLKIFDRFLEEDKYQSWYVEKLERLEGFQKIKIFGNAPDEKPEEIIMGKRTRALQDAREYWAEIVAAYLSKPEKLSPGDFYLVDNWVKLTDQNYDAFKSAKTRSEMVKKIIKNLKNEQAKEIPKNKQ